MPFSLDNYKNLKRELFHLLVEGDKLMEEDIVTVDSIIALQDSQGVLGVVRDLKEAGNKLFKQRMFQDALEKYGYAGVFLAKFELVDVKDMVEGFDIATSVLLNSAACFGKLNEYDQVGRICTIVLEFESKNVKAMYRRAMAAIALGRNEWAYLDLLSAADIDPRNQEVSIKLQEVRNSLQHDKSQKSGQDCAPLGLGKSLPAPKGKSTNSIAQDENVVLKEVQEASSILQTIGSSGSIVSGTHKTTNENPNVVKEVTVKDVGNDVKPNCSNLNTSNLAEPTYRFCDRRRPGSSISISRRNYQIMKSGKTIHCWNSKVGSWMSVRVIRAAQDDRGQQEECNIAPMDVVTMSDGSSQREVELQDSQIQLNSVNIKEQVSPEEVKVGLDSYSKDLSNKDGSSPVRTQPRDGFTAIAPKKSHRRFRHYVGLVRKARRQRCRRTSKHKIPSSSIAKLISGYKICIGKKRKGAPDIDFIYRPRIALSVMYR